MEGNVSLSVSRMFLKIPKNLVDEILLWMQKEHLVEVSKASIELGRLANVYALSLSHLLQFPPFPFSFICREKE